MLAEQSNVVNEFPVRRDIGASSQRPILLQEPCTLGIGWVPNGADAIGASVEIRQALVQ